MELFLLEHKKIWRKGSTKICVILCFAYVVIFGGVLNYQCFAFGSTNNKSSFSNDFDGYSNIKDSQEYSLKYGGMLTEEALQQYVRDYQSGIADNIKKSADWSMIEDWLKILYPELKGSEPYHLMMEYVQPEKLTGIYERREQAIRDFLEASGQTGEEAEYLLQMNEKVETPFRYEWIHGWQLLLGNIIDAIGMTEALFLAIVLSSVFAGEWHDNMGSLVLTMKNGWKKIACAKIVSGVLFAVELALLIMCGHIALQLFYMGTAGWDMPIQNIKMIAVAPMNMLQAEIYEYAFTFLGVIGFAGVVLLISAMVKSNVLALLISLAVVYGPMTIVEYCPYEVQKALDLIPLVGHGTDIFRTTTFHIFGKIIWSPYLLITVPVLIGIVCMPFAVKKWSRRIKA